jgi:hypothetical protein
MPRSAPKYFKPLWQQDINQGASRTWNLAAVRLPYGEDREYGFVTLHTFDSFEQMQQAWRQDNRQALWAKVHPNMKSEEVNMDALRRVVRGEVWRIIEVLQ